MKHLKIYFAVLFFSFLGGANVELMAQRTKVGYLERLYSGTSISSPNGNYLFQVRDKSIILFDLRRGGNDWSVIWEKEYTSIVEYLIVEEGSVLVKEKNNTAALLCGNEKRGGKGTFLRLQNDGNLVLYNGTWTGGDGDALWATGTCGGVLNGCGEIGPR